MQVFFSSFYKQQIEISELINNNKEAFEPDPNDYVPFNWSEDIDYDMQIDTLAEAHGQSVITIENDYSPIIFYKHICRKNMNSAKEKFLYNKRKNDKH